MTERVRKKKALSKREQRELAEIEAKKRKKAKERRSDEDRERERRRILGPSISAVKPKPSKPATPGTIKMMILSDDGALSEVEVKTDALRRFKLDEPHVNAARRLASDMAAAYPSLRSPSFEPRIDGINMHDAHLKRVEAMHHIKLMKEYVGHRNYDIIMAVMGGATSRIIHALGGEQHRTVTDNIKRAFDQLAAFYSPGFQASDKTWDAIKKYLKSLTLQIDRAESAA